MQRVSEAFIGNTEAAEILGVKPPNARKMLVRWGVPGQKVEQGARWVHIYPRLEVLAVQKKRENGKRKSRNNGN